MANDNIVKEFEPIQKEDNLQIRICLKQYREKQYVDIREWWKPDDKDEFLPTKKGISIPVSDTLELFEALCDNLAEIKDLLNA